MGTPRAVPLQWEEEEEEEEVSGTRCESRWEEAAPGLGSAAD